MFTAIVLFVILAVVFIYTGVKSVPAVRDSGN